jgi:hypothetical protein
MGLKRTGGGGGRRLTKRLKPGAMGTKGTYLQRNYTHTQIVGRSRLINKERSTVKRSKPKRRTPTRKLNPKKRLSAKGTNRGTKKKPHTKESPRKSTNDEKDRNKMNDANKNTDSNSKIPNDEQKKPKTPKQREDEKLIKKSPTNCKKDSDKDENKGDKNTGMKHYDDQNMKLIIAGTNDPYAPSKDNARQTDDETTGNSSQ